MPINKTNKKYCCCVGSTLNGDREPVIFSFALDKPLVSKLFESQKQNMKKINKPVLSNFTILLGDDIKNILKFIGETLTFI